MKCGICRAPSVRTDTECQGFVAFFRPSFALFQVVRSSAPVFGALDGEEFFATEAPLPITQQR